ncbi:hypothetical protein HK096_006606 [Nowakowskiella sp. JEL0078]|nr:hypothetical protein HK096_006606 [Nowakowskiella sp. JEL0078]
MLSASDPLPRASASSPGESPHDSAKIPQLPSESDPRLSPDSAPAAIKLEADSPAKIPVGSFENTAEQAEDKSETITEIVDQGSIDPDISKSADEKAQIAGMPTQETIRLPSIAQSITSGGPPNLPAGNMFLSPLPPLNNMPISSSQSLTGRMVNNYLFALPNTPPMRAQNTTSSEQDREMYAPYQHIQNAPAPILSQHFNTNWYHGGYQPYPHYIHQQYQYRPDINYPTLPLQTNYENFDQRYPAHQIHPVHPNHTLTKADSSDEEVFDQGEAGNADNLLIMSAKDVIAEEVNTDGRVRKMYPCPTPGCNKTFTRRYGH